MKAVDLLEVRCGSVQPISIDDQMSVITDAHPLPSEGDQAFDIKLILREVLDALGLEDDDFPASWAAKVVAHPIHEEVISVNNLELENILPSMEELTLSQT